MVHVLVFKKRYLSFLNLVKVTPFDNNYEKVSNDLERLFAIILVQETIEYIKVRYRKVCFFLQITD